MVEWFAIAQIVVAGVGALVCFAAAAVKRMPNDLTMGFTLVAVLLLAAQIVVAIVAPFAGNPPAGDPLEFWLYMIVAFFLPLGAGFWALLNRRASANLVLGVILLTVVIMVYRMCVIWGVWSHAAIVVS